MNRTSTTIGTALVIISAVCFGFMAVFRHWAAQDGVGTQTLLLLRFGIAGALLAGWMWISRTPWPRGPTLVGLIIMGAVLYVVESLAYFHGLRYAPSGLIAMLLYVYPAIVTIMARLALHEKLTWTRLAAVALAMLGTALLFVNEVFAGRANAAGLSLGLLAAVSYATYIVIGTRMVQHSTSGGALPSATVVICSAAVVYGVLAVLEGPRLPHSSDGWSGVLGLAMFSTVIAIAALLAGLRLIGAVRASTLSTLEPMVTVALGALVLREGFHILQACGGALIIFAAVIVARTNR